jgi:hypothetical protein
MKSLRVHKTSGTFCTAAGARRVKAMDGLENNPASLTKLKRLAIWQAFFVFIRKKRSNLHTFLHKH